MSNGRRRRIYLVSAEGEVNSGEWLVEGRLMAAGIGRRLTEEYPSVEVTIEQATIYGSVSEWERTGSWPFVDCKRMETA